MNKLQRIVVGVLSFLLINCSMNRTIYRYDEVVRENKVSFTEKRDIFGHETGILKVITPDTTYRYVGESKDGFFGPFPKLKYLEKIVNGKRIKCSPSEKSQIFFELYYQLIEGHKNYEEFNKNNFELETLKNL